MGFGQLETYNAMSKVSCHAPEEADLAHIHMLPVVVLLPVPASLTPLRTNHLPKRSHTAAQMFRTITRRERERVTEGWACSCCILLSLSFRGEAAPIFLMLMTEGTTYIHIQ